MIVPEPLHRITDGAGPIGPLELSRAWPRTTGHLHLEYRTRTGAPVAGQAFVSVDGRPDGHRAAREAAAIRARARGGSVVALPSCGGLLQLAGADGDLAPLAPLLTLRGAALVSHRPGRRAVVRLAHPRTAGAAGRRAARHPRYAKVVRPRRARALIEAAAVGAWHGAPELLRADAATGLLVWSGARGAPLHAWLGRARVGEAAAAAGAALAALHARRPPAPARRHGPPEEVEVVERWIALTRPYEPRLAARVERALVAARADLGQGGDAVGLVHRDCHDKQIFVDLGGSASIIDLDTLAVGEPALDVANLLVHLELRGWQGLCGDPLGAQAGFLEGYRPDPAVRGRLAAYAALTRLRLACVYAFRPAGAAAVERLLDGPGLGSGWSA